MITANIQKNIPAGVLANDSSIEFFALGKSLKAFHKGRIIDFSQLPLKIYNRLKQILLTDITAKAALMEWGFTDTNSQLKQYAICRFGGLDSTADLGKDTMQESEYWECGNRGNCPFEGKICKDVKVKNGVLNGREVKLLKLMSTGDKDIAIASVLHISKNTLDIHKTKINKKLGVQSKLSAVVEAFKQNILCMI